MLDDIHTGVPEEPAPAGAPYVSLVRVKRRTVSAAD
jgi:hypothetical protein